MDTSKLTIKKASEGISRKDFSAEELVSEYIKRAKERNDKTNAFIEFFDNAVDNAKEVDKKIAKGEKISKLAGIPLIIKDNILIKGRLCTAGSKILDGYRASYDATVIKKLKKEDIIFLGRGNMDEFAMGTSTETSYYGPTKNSVCLDRVPGGSSGGPASAVADNVVLGALGTDTGGSIRQPGSFCGVVGFKPTYGAVSRYGVIAMASSLDQIGPLAKTVEDTRILFDAIQGYDDMDSTSIPENLKKELSINAKGKYTIGVPTDFVYKEGVDEVVIKNFKETLKKLEQQGHTIKEISLPYAHYALSAYYIIMPAEASTNLSRYDGVRYGLLKEGDNLYEDYIKTRSDGFGKEVRRRILLGAFVLSSGYYDAYYNKALGVRRLIQNDYKEAFKEVDVIATPTAPTPAFKIGEKINDPLQMYLVDIFTVPANITGLPGISIPSGFAKEGGCDLPLGFQLIAPHMHENILFDIGKDVESIG